MQLCVKSWRHYGCVRSHYIWCFKWSELNVNAERKLFNANPLQLKMPRLLKHLEWTTKYFSDWGCLIYPLESLNQKKPFVVCMSAEHTLTFLLFCSHMKHEFLSSWRSSVFPRWLECELSIQVFCGIYQTQPLPHPTSATLAHEKRLLFLT